MHRPGVRPPLPQGQEAEGGGGGLQLLERRLQQRRHPPPGGQDGGGAGRRAPAQGGVALRPHPGQEGGLVELLLPGAHEDVADLEHGHRVPRLPGLGAQAAERELRRQGPSGRRPRGERGVHPGGVGVEDGAGRRGHRRHVGLGGADEVEAPGEDVGGDPRLAGHLGPPPGGPPPVALHLPQPVLDADPALPEPGVVLVPGLNVGHPGGVAADGDGSVQAVGGDALFAHISYQLSLGTSTIRPLRALSSAARVTARVLAASA